jgi:fibronectin type 3 domain-containing protein/TolB-like protein
MICGKKWLFYGIAAVFSVVFIVSGLACSSSKPPNRHVSPLPPPTQAPQPAQASVQQMDINDVIERAARGVEGALPQGTKIAVINFVSPSETFSNHVIEELIGVLVMGRKVTIVDRRSLALIREEMELQLSGAISDESAQAIGRQLGAQSIITGSLTNMGTYYRFRVKVINVETAAIETQPSFNLQNNEQIAFLLGGVGTKATAVIAAPASAVPQTAPAARTLVSNAVPAPTGLKAEARSVAEIHLVWNVVAGATTYKVYRSTSERGTYTFIGYANSTDYADNSGITPNTAYYYRVSAVANELEGIQSIGVNAKTPQAPITPPGSTLAEQLAWIATQAGNGVTYDIVVNNDMSIGPTTISTGGRNITINIRSENSKRPVTIQLTGQGHLFTVDANITLILRDIVLKGHANNNRALILVGPAKLILESGAKITENTSYSFGGGVIVDGGTLELSDGAEISGNTANRGYSTYNVFVDYIDGSGIYVKNRGNVIIRGGTITKNKGNGIYAENSTVNMSGGIISKNGIGGSKMDGSKKAGVAVVKGSAFIKKAAPGSDTSGIIYGTIGENANGWAISRDNIKSTSDPKRARNTTLGHYDEISTDSNENWGQ